MVSTCSRPQIVPSLHNHLQLVKAHSILLAVAFSERMCQVANTGTGADERTVSTPAHTSPSPDENCLSELYKRREELERGAGGDHDLPYRFTLPTSMPQVLGWVKLLVRVRQGDLQPEVGAIERGNSSACAQLDPPYLLVSEMASTWHAAPSLLRD